MNLNNIEIRVLVKGRPINEYPHMGQTFVEGRDGSNFEIELTNRSGVRVEAVLSVDGVSVIDGKEAGVESPGYLLERGETIRIPGWKLNDEQVAAFVFSGKKGGSYAAQTTGSSRNNGVIGVLAFAERRQAPYYGGHGYGLLQPMGGGYVPTRSAGRAMFGSGAGMIKAAAAPMGGMWYGSSAADGLESVSLTATGAADQLYNMATTAAATSLSDADDVVVACAAAPVEQTLGTGFGKAQEFNTSVVSFERGDLLSMIVLYYDDSRGLKARGIELNRTRRSQTVRAAQPQAFPGMNCAPPPGWKG